MGLLDVVGDIAWFLCCFWVPSYSYRKEDYEKRVFNTRIFNKYLLVGSLQLLYLIGYGIIGWYIYKFQHMYWEEILGGLGGFGIICLFLLYVKQISLAFSLKNVLYVVKDKEEVKSNTITAIVFSFIPVIGFFSTIIFYCYVVKQLKINGFEFKKVFNDKKTLTTENDSQSIEI